MTDWLKWKIVNQTTVKMKSINNNWRRDPDFKHTGSLDASKSYRTILKHKIGHSVGLVIIHKTWLGWYDLSELSD